MAEVANGNGEARKVDLYKFLARSFLLPVLGVVAILALLFKGITGDEFKWAVAAILSCVGIFNFTELFKTWIESAAKRAAGNGGS